MIDLEGVAKQLKHIQEKLDIDPDLNDDNEIFLNTNDVQWLIDTVKELSKHAGKGR